MAKKKSNLVFNTIILTVISVIAVALLAVVNQITSGPIEAAELNQQAQAYKVVYADANEFAQIDGVEKMIEDSAKLLEDNGFGGCTIMDSLGVKGANGDMEGYIVASTSPNGYGGEIQVAIGIKADKLTGFTVISNSETAGLGSKCTEETFMNQFKDKAASVLSYTKSGASSDTEIDAISGATITTNAVTEAVNAAIIFYQSNFGGGVQEIEGPDLTEFYQAAYPDAKDFADIENADKIIEESKALLEEYGLAGTTVEEVKAVNGGEGYVISTTGVGFAKTSPLQIVIGIKDDKITGFSVVNQMETPGYGAQCTEDAFINQFAGKSVGVKTFKADGKADEEIDAISGATITTNGVTNAVNAAVIFYQQNLGDGVTVEKGAVSQNVDVEASATV